MLARTFSPEPQSTPAAGPSYAPVRFLQPKLTVGPVDDPAGFVTSFPLTVNLGQPTSPAVDVVQQSPVQLTAPVQFAQTFANINATYDLKLSAARANGLAPAVYDPL